MKGKMMVLGWRGWGGGCKMGVGDSVQGTKLRFHILPDPQADEGSLGRFHRETLTTLKVR